jgi:hypothetical protein
MGDEDKEEPPELSGKKDRETAEEAKSLDKLTDRV